MKMKIVKSRNITAASLRTERLLSLCKSNLLLRASSSGGGFTDRWWVSNTKVGWFVRCAELWLWVGESWNNLLALNLDWESSLSFNIAEHIWTGHNLVIFIWKWNLHANSSSSDFERMIFSEYAVHSSVFCGSTPESHLFEKIKGKDNRSK